MPLEDTILLFMVLLAIGTLSSGLFRKLPIPHTVLLVIIGIGLEYLSGTVQFFEPLSHFTLTPDLVFFIFLPALIFESSLNLNARQLVKDIIPILTLAVPALLLSTIAVGTGIWLLLSIDFTLALLFGALISATDPVAVISLFKELGTPQRLTVIVEGESLLNDATAIVVFSILLGIATFGGMSWGDAGFAVITFIKVFFGGAIVGIFLGAFVSWVINKLRLDESSVIIISLVLAYFGFIVSEHLFHVSGVMTVAASAITVTILGLPTLPREYSKVLNHTWEFLANIANTLLFLLVGLSVHIQSLSHSFGAILIASILVIVVRAGLIYSLVPITTMLFRLPRVTVNERHIMSWGGLKGGLAIAIALSIPEDLPGRQLLLDLTLGVVVFTLLVNAPTIRPLINFLGINKLTEEERSELKDGLNLAAKKAETILDRCEESKILSKACHLQIQKKTKTILLEEADKLTKESEFRHVQLNLLKTENQELEDLYRNGVIQQYTYLDLKADLQQRRIAIVESKRLEIAPVRKLDNPFIRFEKSFIKKLREADWASNFLANYQNLRMSQHLKKNIAGILMCDAALKTVEMKEESYAKIQEDYHQRIEIFHNSLADVHRDFPQFYQCFESRLSLRMALISVIRAMEEEYDHGTIGSKAFAFIERKIHLAIERIPAISEPVVELKAHELLQIVPLLSGLSDKVVEEIASVSTTVNFLPGDIIIQQNAHGTSLYIIIQGLVKVIKKGKNQKEDFTTELRRGDFFGEIALLGNPIRTATVEAVHYTTLLRLTHDDVFSIAKNHKEVHARLEEAKELRGIINAT